MKCDFQNNMTSGSSSCLKCASRNQRIFEGKDLSLLDFKMYFLRVLYTWSQVLEDRVNLTFVDFVDNLMQGY